MSPKVTPAVTNFSLTPASGAATNICVTLSNKWQVINLRLITIRLKKKTIDVIQHGTEDDVYADYSTAQWRVGLHPPYSFRPYTPQEAAAIRYAWSNIPIREEHILTKIKFQVTLYASALAVAISIAY